MNPIIEVEKITKTFKLPHEKINSLREGIATIYKPKTFEVLEALKDVSFNVNEGEFFGIIGRNGSGKSTLLKILAGIYQPDSGKVKVKGKISPFLELGVGFNPELTARENVFLNGIVLGLSHRQIKKKYPQIVGFAGLEKFMDAKLKNFSSGMQVRLAFSVAIQAPADIFLIDEVLAVGDVEFQQKCFGVFRVLKKEGKTIVLVSHDLSAIQQFCQRVMVIDKGKIHYLGQPADALVEYLRLGIENQKNESKDEIKKPTTQKTLSVSGVKFFNSDHKETSIFKTGDAVRMRIFYEAKSLIRNPVFGIEIRREDGVNISSPNNKMSGYPIKSVEGKGYVDYIIKSLPLLGGRYYVTIHIVNTDITSYYDLVVKAATFQVAPTEENQVGVIKLDSEWWNS